MVISSNDSLIKHETINDRSLELYPIGKASRAIIGVNVDKSKKNEIATICEKEHILFTICKKYNYKIIVEND